MHSALSVCCPVRLFCGPLRKMIYFKQRTMFLVGPSIAYCILKSKGQRLSQGRENAKYCLIYFK